MLLGNNIRVLQANKRELNSSGYRVSFHIIRAIPYTQYCPLNIAGISVINQTLLKKYTRHASILL